MTNQADRQWRIGETVRLISKDEKPRAQVIIKIMSHWGISRKIAREYLEVLISQDSVRGGKTIWRHV